MPIKQVTCSICGNLVNKAVTYYVGDGKRACRTHPGVVEKKDVLETERRAHERRKADEISARLRRHMDRLPPTDFLKPRCWCCNATGLRQDEFFQRFLIEREKARLIHGDFNIFDPKHPGNRIDMKEPCIFVVPKDKAPGIPLRREFEAVPAFAGVLMICGRCCGRHKVDPLPKVELDDLIKFMPISEHVVMPILKEAAAKELGRDN